MVDRIVYTNKYELGNGIGLSICTFFNEKQTVIVSETFYNDDFYIATKEQRAEQWVLYQTAKIVGILQYQFLGEVVNNVAVPMPDQLEARPVAHKSSQFRSTP